MNIPTSNDMLISFLCECDELELHTLIFMLRSRLSPKSLKLCKEYSSPQDIPEKDSPGRRPLAVDVVELLQWYGSNTAAYGARKLAKHDKQYSAIARDVLDILRKRLPKKQRPELPRVIGVKEAEQLIVKMLIDLALCNKSPEEIAQTLQEAGLEEDAAKDAAKKYGIGLTSVGLPVLAKMLGKKTVTVMVEQITVALTYKFIGKEASTILAKRLLVKFSQKLITRILSYVGWILVGLDITLFVLSPARRVTTKAVPYIALVRVREELESTEE